MRRVETAQAEAKQRIVLCDLNWTRLVQFRLAIAQFFDHPASHHRFEGNRKRRDRFRARVSFDGITAGGLARRAASLDTREKLERQRAGLSRSVEQDDSGFAGRKSGRTDQPLRLELRVDRISRGAFGKCRPARSGRRRAQMRNESV